MNQAKIHLCEWGPVVVVLLTGPSRTEIHRIEGLSGHPEQFRVEASDMRSGTSYVDTMKGPGLSVYLESMLGLDWNGRQPVFRHLRASSHVIIDVEVVKEKEA